MGTGRYESVGGTADIGLATSIWDKNLCDGANASRILQQYTTCDGLRRMCQAYLEHKIENR